MIIFLVHPTQHVQVFIWILAVQLETKVRFALHFREQTWPLRVIVANWGRLLEIWRRAAWLVTLMLISAC